MTALFRENLIAQILSVLQLSFKLFSIRQTVLKYRIKSDGH